MAQNLPGGLIRPILQSGLKKIGGQKKSGIPYFQAPLKKVHRLSHSSRSLSSYVYTNNL